MCKAKRVHIYILYIYHIYHLDYRILSINIYVSATRLQGFSRSGLCTSSPGTSKGGRAAWEPWMLQDHKKVGAGWWNSASSLGFAKGKPAQESEPNFFKSFVNVSCFPFKVFIFWRVVNFNEFHTVHRNVMLMPLLQESLVEMVMLISQSKWFLMTDLGHLLLLATMRDSRQTWSTQSRVETMLQLLYMDPFCTILVVYNLCPIFAPSI